jgi:hypothetical protein
MSIAAGAISFGDVYWPRFSERWLASIERADPQPDQVLLVSDRLVNVPPWVELVVVKPGRGFMMINDLAEHCRCDWLPMSGLDDEYTVDAFMPIESDADAVFFPCQQVGESNALAQWSGVDAFNVTWQLPNNPQNGGVAYKISSLREVPVRDYIYADEVQWAEWSYFGLKAEFDPRVRVIWHRWSGSTSWPANRAGEQQAQEFKQRLRAGLIQKGIPE